MRTFQVAALVGALAFVGKAVHLRVSQEDSTTVTTEENFNEEELHYDDEHAFYGVEDYYFGDEPAAKAIQTFEHQVYDTISWGLIEHGFVRAFPIIVEFAVHHAFDEMSGDIDLESFNEAIDGAAIISNAFIHSSLNWIVAHYAAPVAMDTLIKLDEIQFTEDLDGIPVEDALEFIEAVGDAMAAEYGDEYYDEDHVEELAY